MHLIITVRTDAAVYNLNVCHSSPAILALKAVWYSVFTSHSIVVRIVLLHVVILVYNNHIMHLMNQKSHIHMNDLIELQTKIWISPPVTEQTAPCSKTCLIQTIPSVQKSPAAEDEHLMQRERRRWRNSVRISVQTPASL